MNEKQTNTRTPLTGWEAFLASLVIVEVFGLITRLAELRNERIKIAATANKSDEEEKPKRKGIFS